MWVWSDVQCRQRDEVVCRLLPTLCLVLLYLAHPVHTGYTWGAASYDWRNKDHVAKMPSPEFEDTDTHIMSWTGRVTFLPCRVANIGDRVVSWIRTKDLSILTSGPHSFTADIRFESANVQGSANWGLRLRNAQPSDSGTYECQVNTDPKMNRKVTLEVDSSLGDSPSLQSHLIEAQMAEDAFADDLKKGALTRILGPSEQLVERGSTVTLTCLVVATDKLPASVEWQKNGKLVSFQAARGGIIVDTERTEKRTMSRLTVADVQPEDSGNYTCKPFLFRPHSIALLVVEGDHPEAMLRAGNASCSADSAVLPLLSAAALLVRQLSAWTR